MFCNGNSYCSVLIWWTDVFGGVQPLIAEAESVADTLSSPALYLSDVEGKPGETVCLELSVLCDNQFEALQAAIGWCELSYTGIDSTDAIWCMSEPSENFCLLTAFGMSSIEDGAIASIEFEIPETSEIGAEYTIEFLDVYTFTSFSGEDLTSSVNVKNGTVKVVSEVTDVPSIPNENYNSLEFLSYDKIDSDEDGKYDYAAITDCDKSATIIDIPNEIEGLPVKEIDYGTFVGCDNLITLKIPENIETIANDVFFSLDSLTEINVSEYNNHFCTLNGILFNKDKTALICYPQAKYDYTEYEIPYGVKTIAWSAFNGCYNLTSVIIPDSVEVIEGGAFHNCYFLNNVEMPEGVTSIGSSAFENCLSLENITIPDSVASVGILAFNGTPILTNQTGPLYYVDSWLVDCDEETASIEIKNGTRGIAERAFSMSGSCSLTSVTIPDSVKYIGIEAFSEADDLTDVNIGNGVLSIGNSAFYNCINLKNLTLGESLSEIRNDAFSGCNSLASIEIPESVIIIENGAFHGDNLTDINVSEKNSVYSSIDGVLFNKDKTELIYYPYAKSEENYSVNNNVVKIGAGAFAGSANLKSVEFPEGITEIGMGAFSSCINLKSIKLPESLTTIETCTFEGCESLYDVVIPEGVKAIGIRAFVWCYNLENIVIPESGTSIESQAFAGCTNLSNIIIKNPECEIYDDAKTIFNKSEGINFSGELYFNGTIYGYENSTAQAYAEKYDYAFDLIENAPDVIITPVGDANGDNIINVRDCAFIASALAKGEGDTLPQSADFNGDEKINVRDAAAIAKWLAGGGE